ncbi:MAG: hypothetical protein IKA16_01205 [Oscillospiraceae bacterium]|nr:hypothetical protein [Oscillospiraceae bacterium]
MKQCRYLICILAVLILCLSALTSTVFAATQSFNGTVGKSESFWFHQNYDDEVESASIDNGGVPGMSLSFPNPAAVTLSGTPTQAGSYTLYVSVYTKSQEWLQYTLNISIQKAPEIKPTEAPATEAPEVDLKPSVSAVPKVTKHPTGEKVIEGESAVFIARADYTNKYAWEITIADAVLGVDQLPDYIGHGIKVSGTNSEKLVLSNIPVELNGARVRCRFIGAQESVYSDYAKITVIAEENATPKVTKDPTDETINEGEEVVFVAKADYAQRYSWKLVAPDGKETSCTQAPEAFEGLKVTGADTERITLSNVPAQLDGYQIYCEFQGGTTVTGGKAKLHVIPKPTQPPTEPVPTQAPTEAPTEPVKETQPQAPAPTTATEPEIEETIPAAQKGGNTALVITIIVAVTIVAVAAIAAVVILKLKGKL